MYKYQYYLASNAFIDLVVESSINAAFLKLYVRNHFKIVWERKGRGEKRVGQAGWGNEEI